MKSLNLVLLFRIQNFNSFLILALQLFNNKNGLIRDTNNC
jgi:hypothetical protein